MVTCRDTDSITRREQIKAQRRQQLLDAGARLIADDGFLGMRLDDLSVAMDVEKVGVRLATLVRRGRARTEGVVP